jgi:uncharacterized protein YndB with AHSA1/START domain
MEKVFEIYIKTTPERLWEAITDPELRRKYSFGIGVVSDWTPGSRYEGVHSQAPGALLEGENLEVDPPRRLVQSFNALWGDEVKSEATSRVTWEIEPVADSCRLTVTPQIAAKRKLGVVGHAAEPSPGLKPTWRPAPPSALPVFQDRRRWRRGPGLAIPRMNWPREDDQARPPRRPNLVRGLAADRYRAPP